jgi:phage shock protein PspC (stress-responsive transcriptional regulator)
MSNLNNESASNNAFSTIGLHTRREGSHFTGVCSGLAKFISVDVNVIRICVAVASFYSAWVVPVYVTLAFVLPNDSRIDSTSEAPFFEGQQLIREIKAGLRAMMKATQHQDARAFSKAWDAQIINCRRAWAEAIDR